MRVWEVWIKVYDYRTHVYGCATSMRMLNIFKGIKIVVIYKLDNHTKKRSHKFKNSEIRSTAS